MFSKILIANRGAIACRVERTCRRLGVKTVAVYSDADVASRHVREADEAVHVGAAPAAQSYLNVEAILAAAKSTGAEAIHPGYGFLSENAEFAEACEASGVRFIGPSPSAMRAYSQKHTSRELVSARGVPVTPGSDGLIESEDEAAKVAAAVRYPVMVKATAGGGGIGMSRADDEAQLRRAFGEAKRKGESFFKHAGVFLEKCIVSPHHVEVQVFGDGRGNVVHLGERECSIQRRNQKIIEETPSPLLRAETRERICEAAVEAARAVNYTSAGTVEFLADETGHFYFLEVNTRLQVEHGVTEMVTGVDLVEWMLKAACGELDLAGYAHAPVGHSIQCRVYAENPEKKFFPSPGMISEFATPTLPFARFDGWVEQGTTVTPYYDPLVMKVIVHGANRDEAIGRMIEALGGVTLGGLTTNLPLLMRIMQSDAYRAGKTPTSFLRDAFGYAI